MLRTATLALMLASGSALAIDDFARLAPPDAGIIVSVADYTASKERLLATPLGRLTEHPDIKALLDEARQEQMQSFEALAERLGLDIEEWPEPAGMVGLALRAEAVEDAMEWEPATRPVALLAADFGDRVADVRQILDAIVDRGLDEGLLEIQTESIGDVEVLTVTPIAMEDGDDEFESVSGLADLTGGLFSGDQPATVAIAGSLVILSESKDMVVDAVDRHRGADVPSAADNDLLMSALAQHPEGTTDYAILLPGPLGLADVFFSGMGFFLPPGVDTTAIIDALGITGMKAISVGLHLESPDAQAEITLGILDQDRTGLVSLLDTTAPAWDPPSFVTPDAVAATRLLVQFDRLPDVVREFWATLPQDLQDQGGPQFDLAMGYIDQIAPLLGPEVHLVQTIARPYSVQGAGMLYATPCSNEIPINNLLAIGAQAGLQTREIAGARIYDLPADALGVGLSISVAYGHVLVGMTDNVETALRLAAGDDAQDLSDDPDFIAALSALPSTGNAMQFTRTLDIVEFTLWSIQNMRQIAVEQMRASGTPQEYIDQYLATDDPTPAWARNLSIETLGEGIGDISMEIAPADDGFRGRILIHAPR